MTGITIPVFAFGSVLACLLGSIIHLIFGGKPYRLLLSIIFAWIGFWVGNNIGLRYGIYFIKYGPINYGTSIIFSIMLGLGGYWISGDNK